VPTSEQLTTGVDQLLQLINAQGQISVREAAKRLNVSEQTVEDWAALLEDSGVITVNYRLANVYLARKAVTAAERERIAPVVAAEQKAFTKGGAGLISYLDRLEGQIEKLDALVQKLDIGKLAGAKFKDIATLAKEKRGVDKQVLEVSQELVGQLQSVFGHLQEEKGRVRELYEALLASIVDTGHIMELERAEVAALEANEKLMERKLGKMRQLIDRRIVDLAVRRRALHGGAVERVRRLVTRYNELRRELADDHRRLREVVVNYERRNRTLRNTREQLVRQIKARVKGIELKVPEQVEVLVRQRAHLTDVVNHLFEEEKLIRSRLARLMLRGKTAERESFERVQKEVGKLNDELAELIGRRGKLEKQLKRLSETLK
jgi:transposase